MDEDAISDSKKDLVEKEKAALEAKEKLTKDMMASKKKWLWRLRRDEKFRFYLRNCII